MKLIKKSYFDKIEKMLKEYPDIKDELSNTTEISAISYREGARGKYGTGSATERIALDEVRKQDLIGKLDAAIEKLDHVSKKIIKMYYIDNEPGTKTTLRQIHMVTGYSEYHVKRIKNRAIQTIAREIYGKKVVDVDGICQKYLSGQG